MPVVSSWCRTVILTANERLAIEFNDGFTCEYPGTNRAAWENMVIAASKGVFVHQHFINPSWPYRQIKGGCVAGITIRKNSGADVGTQQRLNLIEGANVTLTVANDNTDGEVDITIAAAGASDEAIQDAIGGILTDSSTIDFTYDDTGNTISAEVKSGSIGVTHLQGAAPGGSSSSSGAAPFWVEITKTHADLAAAATFNDIEVYSLPAGGVVHEAALIHTVQFAGPGLTSYSVTLGKTGNSGYYVGMRDVLAAVNDAPTITGGIMRFDDYDTAISVRVFASTFGANLDAATAGTLKIYLLISKPKP